MPSTPTGRTAPTRAQAAGGWSLGRPSQPPPRQQTGGRLPPDASVPRWEPRSSVLATPRMLRLRVTLRVTLQVTLPRPVMVPAQRATTSIQRLARRCWVTTSADESRAASEFQTVSA